MPSRMLRDYSDSLKFDGISAESERLFIRLLMKADDYGRFHADPRLVKATCFPLIDGIKSTEVSKWVKELAARGLILLYESEGKKLLAILNYGQRLKMSKAKFPPLPGSPNDWLPMSPELPGTSGNFPPEEKGSRREGEVEDEVEGASAQEVVAFWNSIEALAKIVQINTGRKKHLSARCSEAFFRDNWRAGIAKIPASKFLMGTNDRGWKADFDWFLQPGSLIKIIEGKYDDRDPLAGMKNNQAGIKENIPL